MGCSSTHLEGSRLGKGGLPSPALGGGLAHSPPPERERSMTWTTEGRSPLGNGRSWIRLLWVEWEAEKAGRGREQSVRDRGLWAERLPSPLAMRPCILHHHHYHHHYISIRIHYYHHHHYQHHYADIRLKG